MKVKISEVRSNKQIEAEILDGKSFNLPGIQEGWRFNFFKHAKSPKVKTYVLVAAKTSGIIEGCIIYEMKGEVEPYLAYIEKAPHNKGKGKIYEDVTGCLIAFACRLSFKIGEGSYKGWLAFDVLEEKKEDELKLMELYSSKYYAERLEDTSTMLIRPENGEKLIEQYLEGDN